MRVTFVCMGAENLALEQISAVLKEHGHKVSLAFDPSLFDDALYFKIPYLHRIFDERERLIKDIVSGSPDIVGFPVFTDNFAWAVSVAKDIKKVLNVPIIFGGIYPTAVPEYVISQDCVDIVCVGEGEYAMLDFCDSFDKSRFDCNIRNLWFKRNGEIISNPTRPLIQNLDELPMFDKSLFENDILIKRVYMTITRRGCPYGCAFCSINFLKRFYGHIDRRIRSVDNVMQELRVMKQRYDYREVGFYDSILTLDKKWLMDLLEKYKRDIHVPFRAIAHPLHIDEETARALKEAGCHRVQIGIQTFSELTRKNVLKRPETNRKIYRCFEICDRVGLNYSCDHMFGLPGESEREQIMAAQAYSKLKKRVRITCFWTTFFPKTDLVTKAREQNHIDDEYIAKINRAEANFYYKWGSVEDAKSRKMFKNYEIFFRAMPIIPERISRFIIKHNLQRFIALLPKNATLFLVDLTVMIAKRDLSGFQYVAFYIDQLRKQVKRKMKICA